MDQIKINNIQATGPVEPKTAPLSPDDAFKFTLLSNIEEADLQARLQTLTDEIAAQGKRLTKRLDIKDMRKYRELVKSFINEVVNRSHKFSRENFLDRRGRHRVYGMIKLIDENLDRLAEELLKEEKDMILILSKVNEIQGLLLDLLA